MIKRLLRKWLEVPEPEDGLAETLAITVRCARRCAYDLAHAADLIDHRGPWADFANRFEHKAAHWQSLFSSGASVKDYRLKLHEEIEKNERIIERLRDRIVELGGKRFLEDEVPF